MERGSQDVVTCAQEDSTMIEESCPPMDSRLLGTGSRRADFVCSVYVCGALFLETKLVKETLFAFPKQGDNIVDHSPLDHSPLGQR